MNILLIVPENSIKGKIVTENLIKKYKNSQNVNFSILLNWVDEIGQIESICINNAIKYFKTKDLKLNEFVIKINSYDICIVCGWGWIISKNFINSCNIILNCHSSYLPDYKGGSVYLHQWANCENFGGATIHYLTESIDEGDIIQQKKFEISIDDTPIKILHNASNITSELLFRIIDEYSASSKLNTILIQKGGRYFLKCSNIQLNAHRIINRFFVFLRLPYRWITPHRKI